MVSLVNNGKWAPLIGELFLTFGSIEMAVQKCIKQWTTNVIYEHVKKIICQRELICWLILLKRKIVLIPIKQY